MIRVDVSDFDSWRLAARRLVAVGVPADEIQWIDSSDNQGALPLAIANDNRGDTREVRAHTVQVSRKFLDLATFVACHRDPGKWRLMYHVLWRISRERRQLLEITSDDDVAALERMASQVRRDEHKMRAFVRFTPVKDPAGLRHVAWYRPDHLIVPLAAPFFADRFRAMVWSILTPDLSAHWDGTALHFSPGVQTAPAEHDDALVETLWRTYYAAVFNPARVNVAATLREMPLRHWPSLPEASLIPSLVASAHERTTALGRAPSGSSARPHVPENAALEDLRAASQACRGCALHEHATQAVFGEGPADASLVLVGEQPGDSEDVQGRPFVGPAGDILDRALALAGIDRASIYVTNAVKHFAFLERGKRRIHRTPRISEIYACRPWLEAELQRIRPAGVVCLGGSAARALLGPQARVMASRGRIFERTAWASALVVTVHPSAVLRADAGEQYFELLVSDLQLARRAVEDLARGVSAKT